MTGIEIVGGLPEGGRRAEPHRRCRLRCFTACRPWAAMIFLRKKSMPDCIVCKSPDTSRQAGDSDFAQFECPRCGLFALSGTAESALDRMLDEVPLRRSLMSHTLRRMQRPAGEHLRIITADDLPTFWRDGRLPSPQEQVEQLILWIGDNQSAAQGAVVYTELSMEAWIGAALIGPPGNAGGLRWLIEQLKGSFFNSGYEKGRVRFQLTFAGWERYAELHRKSVES